MARRDWAILFVAIVLRILIFPAFFDSASAAVASCTNSIVRFDGKVYNPPPSGFAIRGSEATITTRNAGLCSGDPGGYGGSWSYSWVMLAPDDATPPGWAQVGFVIKNYGCACFRYRWEWIKNGSSPYHRGEYGTPAPTENHNYKVDRYPSDGFIHIKVDDHAVQPNTENPPVPGITDFDPTTTTGWQDGMEGQWFGEINYTESDFTGTSGYKTTFTIVKQKDTAGNWIPHSFTNGDWIKCDRSVCQRQNVFSACFAQQDDVYGDGATEFKIWTEPTDHSSPPYCGG